MKICLVHNAYGKRSGEEAAVESLRECLERHGHEVVTFFRTSAEIGGPLAKESSAPAPDLGQSD